MKMRDTICNYNFEVVVFNVFFYIIHMWQVLQE